MMMIKIKNTKVAKDKVKRELLIKQKGRCPISGRRMTMQNSVLDHCHYTGVIRAALPRGVNGLEGKISQNLIKFWELHRKPQTEYIYPTHKTADEKRDARNKKARLRYAKAKKGVK
jgi:hypothetical protein